MTCLEDDVLHEDVRRRIGFAVAKDEMRNIMLMDTARRLPEVLRSLLEDLSECQNELDKLHEKKRLMDPKEVKSMLLYMKYASVYVITSTGTSKRHRSSPRL